MIRSIRARIALLVLTVVGICQVALSLYILDRIERGQRMELDDFLREELAEVQAVLGTPQLHSLIEAEMARNTKWNEIFVEVRSSSGWPIAASPNVPEGGLGNPLRPQSSDGVSIWERIHPRSRRGHIRIRIAETTVNDSVVRVARSLKQYQKSYWRLRQQLSWGLLAVTVLGALCAWWVAARSLAPLRQISARARQLGASVSGELPRTGSGDELDQLTEILNELLGRIRSEMLRVRRMTADSAHALRTPLTAIRGTLELQLRNADEETVILLSSTLEAIDELIHVVNHLLLLERVQSGMLEAEHAVSVRLDQVAEELVDTFQLVAEEQGLELGCESLPVTVRCDHDHLRIAVTNLLDNALRHTPKGGRIDVRVGSSADRAWLSVQDTGPGLRTDQIEQIFERFYSEAGSRTAAGLGLPIARAIAEAYGGSLTASSPAGARFDLELPLVSAAAA